MDLKDKYETLAGRRPMNRGRLRAFIHENNAAGIETMLRAALPELFSELDADRPKPGLFRRAKPMVQVLKDGGENFVFAVGDTHVVKVVDFTAPEKSAAEILIQQLLHEKLPGMVPAVTHVSATHQVFAMERRKGVPLCDAGPIEGDRRQRLEEDLLLFTSLSEKAVDHATAWALGMLPPLKRAELHTMEDTARTFGTALEEGGVEADDVTRELLSLAEPVLRHDDFKADNYLVDPETGHLAAVIDFGNMKIEPRSSLEGHYTPRARYVAGNWVLAHRGPGGAGMRPDARRLVGFAMDVAAKYRSEGLLPAGAAFAESLRSWLDGSGVQPAQFSVIPRLHGADAGETAPRPDPGKGKGA
jgi:hypothetical protein